MAEIPYVRNPAPFSPLPRAGAPSCGYCGAPGVHAFGWCQADGRFECARQKHDLHGAPIFSFTISGDGTTEEVTFPGLRGAGGLTPAERAAAFSRRFPRYAGFIVHNGRIYTTWIVAAAAVPQNRAEHYGAFPPHLLERIMALFPDKRRVLHLFAGTARTEGAITYDVDGTHGPTIRDDVRNLLAHRDELRGVELVVADPPYEDRDFAKYGTSPFDKQACIRDLAEVLEPGACLAWLDVRAPAYSGEKWDLIGYAGAVVGLNTRMRVLTMLERRA